MSLAKRAGSIYASIIQPVTTEDFQHFGKLVRRPVAQTAIGPFAILLISPRCDLLPGKDHVPKTFSHSDIHPEADR
jgi:hypothetical protein